MSRENQQRNAARGRFLIALGSIAAFACLPIVSRASERVTLSNGFVQQCDHHAMVDGRIRLYLSAEGDSYIEFKPEEIATFEQVTDTPASVAAASRSEERRVGREG